MADELTRSHHPVSINTGAALLRQAGYRLQANRKTREGASHPDRPPVPLVGDFKNAGREWDPRGEPEEVRVHDFMDQTIGKSIPYGIYDILDNQGWVSVGLDHDTARFAVNGIRTCWKRMGRRRFPRAGELLITADGGGSSSHRARLGKVSLQQPADELGLELVVCHVPPPPVGLVPTGKWNRIEHRLFSLITQNRRGRPLLSHQAVVSLIAATTTKTGLVVKAALDRRRYDIGVKVTDEEVARLKLAPHSFHGEWNYTLSPRRET